jgi:hypothetical protein
MSVGSIQGRMGDAYHGRVVVRPLALDGLGTAGRREALVPMRTVSVWCLEMWKRLAYPGYVTPSIW